jgi:hypothetical protein
LKKGLGAKYDETTNQHLYEPTPLRFKILVSFDDVDTLQFKERRGLTADFTDDTDWGRRGQDRAWELGGSAGAGPRQKQKLGIRRRSEAMAGQEQKTEIPIKKMKC